MIWQVHVKDLRHHHKKGYAIRWDPAKSISPIYSSARTRSFCVPRKSQRKSCVHLKLGKDWTVASEKFHCLTTRHPRPIRPSVLGSLLDGSTECRLKSSSSVRLREFLLCSRRKRIFGQKKRKNEATLLTTLKRNRVTLRSEWLPL